MFPFSGRSLITYSDVRKDSFPVYYLLNSIWPPRFGNFISQIFLHSIPSSLLHRLLWHASPNIFSSFPPPTCLLPTLWLNTVLSQQDANLWSCWSTETPEKAFRLILPVCLGLHLLLVCTDALCRNTTQRCLEKRNFVGKRKPTRTTRVTTHEI